MLTRHPIALQKVMLHCFSPKKSLDRTCWTEDLEGSLYSGGNSCPSGGSRECVGGGGATAAAAVDAIILAVVEDDPRDN